MRRVEQPGPGRRQFELPVSAGLAVLQYSRAPGRIDLLHTMAQALLEREKELTRRGDELARERRERPLHCLLRLRNAFRLQAFDLDLLPDRRYEALRSLTQEVKRMLTGFIKRINRVG